MKVWLLRILSFLFIISVGFLLTFYLNNELPNSELRPVLYDLRLIGFCARDPGLLIHCTFDNKILYTSLGVTLLIAIIVPLVVFKSNKI